LNDSEVRALVAQMERAQEARVQSLVKQGIERYLRTGVPSGTYGTFTWDGTRIVGATAAAGGGLARDGFVIARDGTSQTITSGSWQAISWDAKDYDDGYISGSPPFTQLEMTSSQQWLITIDVRWDAQFSGNTGVALTNTGGSLFIADGRPAVASGSLENWHQFSFISYWHGSTQNARVYQDSGSSKTCIAYMYAQSMYSKT
jgi:hypothetical protein